MQSVARLVVFVAAVSVSFLVVACDETSTVSGADAADASAPDPTASLDEIAERLDHHLDDGDVCTVFETINELSPSYESTDDLRAALTVVGSALDDAHGLVPAELAEDWAELVEGTSDAISRLSVPDASVEDLRPVYANAELMAAERRVDEWMAEHCAT